MDYNQDIFFKMQQQQMPGKQPFYMTNPIQNLYMTELEYQRDLDRMKEMYPMEIRKVQELVEEECDKMEYEGSLMFDEYPDQLMIRRISRSIYDQLDKSAYQDDLMMQEVNGRNWLEDFVTVMLLNEMYSRRCRRPSRRNKRGSRSAMHPRGRSRTRYSACRRQRARAACPDMPWS